MQDLNDKITGNSLTATEWNEVPSEIQNVIEGLGITLSSGDLNQLGKAIAGYAANGDFYADSGVADAYVLTTIGSKQSPTAYKDGLSAIFRVGNVNTGASTANVAGIGVKNIKTISGSNPAAGDLPVGDLVELRYDLANDWLEIKPLPILALLATSLQSAEGYARIPINIGGVIDEIIIQWGTVTTIAAVTGAVWTFPIAFPNATLFGSAMTQNSTSSSFYANIGDPTVSTTGLTVSSTFAGTAINTVMAIGY